MNALQAVEEERDQFCQDDSRDWLMVGEDPHFNQLHAQCDGSDPTINWNQPTSEAGDVDPIGQKLPFAEMDQYFTLPHLSYWTPIRLLGVQVESKWSPIGLTLLYWTYTLRFIFRVESKWSPSGPIHSMLFKQFNSVVTSVRSDSTRIGLGLTT